MKNLWMLLVMMGLAVSVTPVVAQTSMVFDASTLEVKFTAPMQFYVADKLMPAGSYEIKQSSGGQGNILLVRAKGKNEAYVECTPRSLSTPLTKLEITFNKYGKKEYLNSINYPGDAQNSGSWILQINPSAGEQAAAKTAAAAKHTLEANK